MTPKKFQHPEDSAVALHYDMTAAVQQAFKLDEGLAAHFAAQLTQALRDQVGGQEIYIPAPDKQQRDDAIRREFNGRNLAEVCARHRISRRRLYEIVARCKPAVPPAPTFEHNKE